MEPVKLVFVDDDPDDRELIKYGMLVNGEEHYLVFDSGISFFSYLSSCAAQHLPELVVLDLNMPIMSGHDILKQLKATDLYKGIPVIVLTTSSHEEIKKRCFEEGAAGFYTKPSSLMELHTLLNEILSLD